jgi:hypothetical protein
MDRNCAAEARPSEVHRSGAITRAVDRGLHHQMRGYRPVSRRTELLLEQPPGEGRATEERVVRFGSHRDGGD